MFSKQDLYITDVPQSFPYLVGKTKEKIINQKSKKRWKMIKFPTVNFLLPAVKKQKKKNPNPVQIKLEVIISNYKVKINILQFITN